MTPKKSLKQFTPMNMEDQMKVQGGEVTCRCPGTNKPDLQILCDNTEVCVNACVIYCS